MNDELEIFLRPVAGNCDGVSGVARRWGAELPWTATRDGSGWEVVVPPGHSLGPDGTGSFELVTADDWPAFCAAVIRSIVATALAKFLQSAVKLLQRRGYVYCGQGIRNDGNYKLPNRIG